MVFGRRSGSKIQPCRPCEPLRKTRLGSAPVVLVGNGLVVACRRKRINIDQIAGFLTRLRGLPIDPAQQTPSEILELPAFAQARGLTNYDAAYLALAVRSKLPPATTDGALRRTAASASVDLVAV